MFCLAHNIGRKRRGFIKWMSYDDTKRQIKHKEWTEFL